MKDRWIRFSTYARWIKEHFRVSTPESERMARERAVVRDVKGVLYARIADHRYRFYRRKYGR